MALPDMYSFIRKFNKKNGKTFQSPKGLSHLVSSDGGCGMEAAPHHKTPYHQLYVSYVSRSL